MKMLPREAWHYAALLILLFCIAGLAVGQFIQFLEDRLPDGEFRTAAILVVALTMGFMLIAGAFGLWAIRFSSEAESRRRVARIVDAMHYIGDGVVAVDRRGRVSGSNPSAMVMARPALKGETPQELGGQFPCLSQEDVRRLAESTEPVEIERSLSGPEGQRDLRFRSQPAEGLTLVLISDVTSMTAERARRRQSTRLQLIGELARAVAQDVDNLLCGIAGHASLIERVLPPSQEAAQSARAIQSAAQRGVQASGHLLKLARSSAAAPSTEAAGDHLQAAADNLRQLLPEGWTFTVNMAEAIGPVGIAGTQLEQIVLNLGLIVADRVGRPARLVIACREEPAPNACILVGMPAGADETEPRPTCKPARDLGMLGSVIRSLVEGAGGTLDMLTGDEDETWFRLAVPHVHATVTPNAGAVPDELVSYIARWRVLCAGGRRGMATSDAQLRKLVGQVDRADDVAGIMAYLDTHPATDALVVHELVLGSEPAGMLRAFLRLRPDCAVVAVTEDAGDKWSSVAGEVVLLAVHAPLPKLVMALIDARCMAVRRSR